MGHLIAEHLEEGYFEWLYDLVGAGGNVKRYTHWHLLNILHHKEFVWFIPNDDNRVEDGRYLRYDFLNSRHGLNRDQVDPEWVGLGCSFLEMMIALSRRLSFEGDGDPRDWFWHVMGNLGLAQFADHTRFDRYPEIEEGIDETLDAVIWRTYEPDGSGGLFPLENPEQDQTQVEIRYQYAAYIIERDALS